VADDIVTRLREVTDLSWDGDEVTDPLCNEAADEIERLRAELGTVHDTIDTMEERCTAGIDRLQEEINELRFQVVALSIPKETYRG
jgi:hypothetical protein